MTPEKILHKNDQMIAEALSSRLFLLDETEPRAVRLFNGHLEGIPEITVELFGKTLLFQINAIDDQSSIEIEPLVSLYLHSLPWVQAIVVKKRRGSVEAQKGRKLRGEQIDQCIIENGIWYALDLFMNRDTSFYIDTRNLRQWAFTSLAGKRVLNTFAYTGTLGVAARAGNASEVVQLDQSQNYLNLAKESYRLNHISWNENEFIVGDFFRKVGHMKSLGLLFDCVILDPPFFSTSSSGQVDTIHQNLKLINKVRPLIAHNGWLVTVNNALFVSGDEYYRLLQNICDDGYAKIEKIIPVPLDCTGFPTTIQQTLPVDPSPFNHATKIAILSITRKDQRWR